MLTSRFLDPGLRWYPEPVFLKQYSGFVFHPVTEESSGNISLASLVFLASRDGNPFTADPFRWVSSARQMSPPTLRPFSAALARRIFGAVSGQCHHL